MVTIRTVEAEVVRMSIMTPTVNTESLNTILADWNRNGWKLLQIMPVTNAQGCLCKVLLVFQSGA